MKKLIFIITLAFLGGGLLFNIYPVKAQVDYGSISEVYFPTNYDYSKDQDNYQRERFLIEIVIVLCSAVFMSALSYIITKRKAFSYKDVFLFAVNFFILSPFLLILLFIKHNFNHNYVLSSGSLKSIFIFIIITFFSSYILKSLYKIKLIKALLILLASFLFCFLITILVNNFIDKAFFVPISNMMLYPI